MGPLDRGGHPTGPHVDQAPADRRRRRSACGCSIFASRAFGWGLPAVVGVPARVVLALAAAGLAWRALRWLSDRLLWRIRTKLILSYLFIALVPVLLLTAFGTIAGVLLLGLVGSRIVTGEIDRASDVIRVTAQSALVGLPPTEAEAARALPARLGAIRELHPAFAYALVRGGKLVAATGEVPREIPGWLREGPGFAGLVALHPEAAGLTGGAAGRLGAGRRGARGPGPGRPGVLRRHRAAHRDPRDPEPGDRGQGAPSRTARRCASRTAR